MKSPTSQLASVSRVAFDSPRRKRVWLDLLSTALNQDDKQNDSNYAGNNPDNRYIVHVNTPFLGTEKFVK